MTRYNRLKKIITVSAKKHSPAIMGVVVALLVIAGVVFFVTRSEQPGKQDIAMAATQIVVEAVEETLPPTATATATALPPTATPTPTATIEPTATVQPSAADASEPAWVSVQNSSKRPVLVSWVDEFGQETKPIYVPAGERVWRPTYIGHVWTVRDATTSKLLDSFVVNKAKTIGVLLPDASLADAPVITPTPAATPHTERRDCEIEPSHPAYGDFYAKMCRVPDTDIFVIAPDSISDDAVRRAAYLTDVLLSAVPEIRHHLSVNGMAVMLYDDELPPDLAFTSLRVDDAYGVAGWTDRFPFVAADEYTLLCKTNIIDEVLIHELGHIVELSLQMNVHTRLMLAYSRSVRDDGLWRGDYADTNFQEWWAEGVEMYFNGYYLPWPGRWVNTKDELREYDPRLYDLIDEVFNGFEWAPSCP